MKMLNSWTVRNRVLPELACVLVAVGAMLAGATAGPARAAQLPDEVLASPGKITAVAQETARSGWPHYVTDREANAITRKVLLNAVPTRADGTRPRSEDTCSFPYGTPGRVVCSVRIFGGPGAGAAAVRAFNVRVRVYEDASWTMHRIR